MKRRLFMIALGVVSLLYLGAVILCFRCFIRPGDELYLHLPSALVRAETSDAMAYNQFVLAIMDVSAQGENRPTVSFYPAADGPNPPEPYSGLGGLSYWAGTRMNALGFGLGWGRYSDGTGLVVPMKWVIAVPLWAVVIALAAPPAVWATARHRRKRWIAEGRCRRCGYDLRASKERCPECGESIPADSPAA